MQDKIKLEDLEIFLNRKEETIKKYLCRSEFSKIKIKRINKEKFLINTSENDILRLKELIDYRRIY